MPHSNFQKRIVFTELFTRIRYVFLIKVGYAILSPVRRTNCLTFKLNFSGLCMIVLSQSLIANKCDNGPLHVFWLVSFGCWVTWSISSTVAENPQNRWKNCRDFYRAFFISKCRWVNRQKNVPISFEDTANFSFF